MTTLTKITLKSGNEVWVETDAVTADAAKGGLGPATREQESEDKAGQAFSRALGTIKEVAEEIHDALETMARKPEDVKVELGVTFSVSGGVIIAKGGLDTNLKLTLGWKNSNPGIA